MKTTHKKAFIIILTILTISTATLMISESSDFYNNFFTDSWKSWLQAILLEAMVLTFAVMKIGNKCYRTLSKVVMVCAFVGLVMSAGMQSILPALKILDGDKKVEQSNSHIKKQQNDRQKNINKALNISQDYMKMLKKSDEFSHKNKQKVTSALNSKRASIAFNKITNIMNKSVETVETKKQQQTKSLQVFGLNMSVVDIFIVLFLRVLLQCSALITAHGIGILWRTKTKEDMEELKVSGVRKNTNGKWSAFYRKHLGVFEAKEDAVMARLKAEKDGGFDLSKSTAYNYAKINKLI